MRAAVPCALRAFAWACALGGAARALAAASFSDSSLLVLRLGSGAAPLARGQTAAVVIDAYSPGGALIGPGRGAVAAVAGAGALALTIPVFDASNTTIDVHGQLELSADGKFALFAGLNVSAGTPLGAANQSSVRRVVASVGQSGDVAFPAAWLPAASSDDYEPLAAASEDGRTRFWVAASSRGPAATGGAFLVAGPNVSVVRTGQQSYRSLTVFGGTLYVSRQGQGLGFFSAALPTSSMPAPNTVGGTSFADGRALAWRSATETYVADPTAGLFRYTRRSATSSTWSLSAPFTAAGGARRFLDLAFSGGDKAALYVLSAAAVYVFDAAGCAGLPASGSCIFSLGGEPLFSAAANTIFKGIALAPTIPPSASPSVTPTASPTSTPSSSKTLSASETPFPSPVDYSAAIARDISERQTLVVGSICGAIALFVTVALLVRWHMTRAHREAMRRRMVRRRAGGAPRAYSYPVNIIKVRGDAGEFGGS